MRADGLLSPIRVVQIAENPALVVTSTVVGTVAVTVTGDPKIPGAAVQVQRAVTGGWSTVATGTLSNTGVFTTTLKGLPSAAVYSYRATVAATPAKGVLAGNSATKPVTIR